VGSPDQQQPAAEQAILSTLYAQAAALDRMACQGLDPEPAAALSAVRGRLGRAASLLEQRTGLASKSQQQSAHERRFPWDSV
jgi:hypothetical protein